MVIMEYANPISIILHASAPCTRLELDASINYRCWTRKEDLLFLDSLEIASCTLRTTKSLGSKSIKKTIYILKVEEVIHYLHIQES